MRQEVFDDRSVIADLDVWCPNYCRSLFSLQPLRLVPDLLILRERFLKCPPMESLLNGLHHRVGLLPEFDQITAGLNVRLRNTFRWAPRSCRAQGLDPTGQMLYQFSNHELFDRFQPESEVVRAGS